MKIKTALLAVVALTLSACTTIHFDRTASSAGSKLTHQQWHHNFALALYEGSQPVNLVEICPNGSWESVKTELSFINALASLPINFIGPIWYPKTVDVSCASN